MRTCNRIYYLLILFLLLCSTALYSQPGVIKGETFKTEIAFKSDTGVKINNDIFVGGFGAGVYKRDEEGFSNCKDCPPPHRWCYFLICNSKFYYQIPIIKSNTDSIYKDSMFCNLTIRLTKDNDTMNIILKNILYGQSNSVIYKHRNIAYVIHYIPFKSGNFVISVSQTNHNFSYWGIYKQTKFSCDYCPTEFWDITPEKWKDEK